MDLPEREIRTEAGTFQDLQGVVECNSFCSRMEGDGEKTAVATIGIAEAIV